MTYSKKCRRCGSDFTSHAKKTVFCSLKCLVLSSYVKRAECWEWTRSVNKIGYGLIRSKNSSILAHRAAYSALKNKIPKGLCVLHKCDNRLCVNPKHLYCGTHQDNMRDMDERGRRFRPDNLYGESHPNHRLTTKEVMIIKNAFAKGSSMRSLGKKYGVTHESIRKIVRGESWKHTK